MTLFINRERAVEIETIKEDARKAIAALCNKAITIEYDMILNYPRAIEHMVNYHKINDEQIIDEMNKLGKDSLGHFNTVSNLVTKLGQEPAWRIDVCERIPDVLDCLNKQLEKEKVVRDMYKEIAEIAKRNKTKVKVGGFLGGFFQGSTETREELLSADEVINTVERIMAQEENHVRIVEDLIGALNALVKK